MSVNSVEGPSVDQVVQLVDTLYNSKNPHEQTEANRRLTELQSSDKVWDICWCLLDPNQFRSLEVHFYAANTLVLKINQSWYQQDEEWLENHLRPKLFEILVSYSGSPNGGKLVIERLSLALATFALHSIPTFWPDAIENILQTFTPQNLPVTISPQRVCDILLKILMYIAEEYAVLMPQQDHKAKLNCQMTKSGPLVFRFLHSLLISDNSAITSDCKQSVLKCLTSWTLHSRTSLLEMEDGSLLLELLYESTINEELCSLACAALAATFSNQKAENYRKAVIDFIPKIAQLKQIIERYTSEDDIECAIKVYSLVINFSENHSRLMLRIVLNDGIELEKEKSDNTKQAIFTIIKTILECTSSPGTYGVDEKFSDLSFTFWFSFFENFYYYTESLTDLICETFDPLVDSLLQCLIIKAQYPSTAVYYQAWNDDQREAYRCYRQDLGDNISLIVRFPRCKERIIAYLHDRLSSELDCLLHGDVKNGERPWQGFESVVFALKSIAESVPFDEGKYVPKICAILSQVPFNESHPLLYCTVAEMISTYSDWLFTHNTHLAIAFNILFLGVNSTNSHVRLMSTLSLKDLTSECQTVLHPFATKIVESCTNSVIQPNSNLSTNEKSRLMHTIGTALAMLPADSIDSALNSLAPIVCELGIKAQGDPSMDPTCRPVIFDRLTMLNSLIESLYVRPYSGNEYEVEDDENECRAFDPARYDTINETDFVQPSIGLLKQLIPILSVISSKYTADEEIMGIISNTIKRSSKSLGCEVKPVLEDLLKIIVNGYDPLLNSNILEGSIPLYMIFKSDQTVESHTLFRDAFARISDKTLEVCLQHPLQQLSITLENYFRFATFVCKRYHEFMTSPTTNVNVEYIYKLAIASLELPEKRTLNEVCNFLSQFRHKSLGVEHLYKIFISHLNLMLSNIFNIFGGNYATPRNAIDSVIDLLFLLTEFDESKEPLKQITEKENFPTSFVTNEHKARFISQIIHERNRKKFKDACSVFVLKVRNLNRVV